MHEDGGRSGPDRPADSDLRDDLERLLSGLTEPYGQLLTLVELEGATLAEAAGFMGISLPSLRLLYSEGRRRLREIVSAGAEATVPS